MQKADDGFVIYNCTQNMFFTGTGFNKGIRFAKIYHEMEFVKAVIKNMSHKFPNTAGHKYNIYKVEISLLSEFPVWMEDFD